MIENRATVTQQRPPYIYGEILSRSVFEAEKQTYRPQLLMYVSQGAATGAVLAFLSVAMKMIIEPSMYNILFITGLKSFLAFGLGWGTLKGFVIWVCTRLTGHRVNWIIRAVIAAVIFESATRILDLIYSRQPAPPSDINWKVGSTILVPLAFGLVIGSNLNPWRTFVRGAEFTNSKSAIIAGATGFLLRSTIVFVFMEAVLFLIWIGRMDAEGRPFIWAVLVVSHLSAALLVVFVRMRFQLLPILAVLVTAPVVMLLGEFQRQLDWAFYPIIGYLVVWLAFVLARWRSTYSALAVINEEIHYYLID